MSNPIFQLPDAPSDVSIRLLTLSLQSDCESKGVSAKNYAHRSRVIRQQTELLARRGLSLPAGQHKPFTVFRSAAEEVGTKAAHDVMDNEGGTGPVNRLTGQRPSPGVGRSEHLAGTSPPASAPPRWEEHGATLLND